jgi:hypothetical protein
MAISLVTAAVIPGGAAAGGAAALQLHAPHITAGAQRDPDVWVVAASTSGREVAVAPVTTVTGADSLWHNHDVLLRFTATVTDDSVTALQLRVDGGDIVEIPAASYELTIPAPPDHTGDGEHSVEFRAVSAAGEYEQWQSIVVRIDTWPPFTRATGAAAVERQAVARLPFRVEDPASGAGSADVTVLITSRGRVLKRLRLLAQPLGQDLSAGFRCELEPGFYRYVVEAVDAAGNRALQVGANRLAVTPPLKHHAFGAVMVPWHRLAYVTNTPVPRVDTGAHDREGVRMYMSSAGLRDYPGGQARYGLANLNTYRLTDDEFYLRRATAQAQRLLETHVRYGPAWFYPQRYTRYRHSNGGGELMRNPWYSGMAQGQVLSFMVAMYETTGEQKYLQAARSTLYSFLRLGPGASPWVITQESGGNLWIQEWPRLPLDYTFNGHMIASFGFYDYYRVTKDELALLLFRATASTALDHAAAFRRPGSCSAYCLLHGTANTKYHHIHITCLKHLYEFTGDVRFLDYAELYQSDFWDASYGGDLSRQLLLADGIEE